MAEHPGQVLDLHVGALHGAHRVLAAHEAGNDRVHRRLFLLLVLDEPHEQERICSSSAIASDGS